MLNLDLPSQETAQLRLLTLNPAGFEALRTQFEDEDISRALGCPTFEMYAGIKERFLTYGLDSNRLGMHNWLLYRKDTGKLIGDFSYHIIFRRHRRGEIGYRLFDASDRGQGFMQELLPFTLQFGFETLGLERIEALTATDNWASLCLLRRFGFKREGYARGHYRVGEKQTDSFSFSLLRADFREEPKLSAIEKLVRGFERQTIPAGGWTHEAYLKVVLWYLFHEGEDAALFKMRAGIIAFNIGQGNPKMMDGGYHETLNVFWVQVGERFLKNNPDLNYSAAVDRFLQTPQASEKYPEQLYSEEVLWSNRARARWVAPDL
jgi:RimJ/RimL family protein N-acetyltransferase